MTGELLGSVVSLVLMITLCSGGLLFAEEREKTCVYISSYHQGFEWSDRVEQGLRSNLEGQCKIVQFDMDTKRNEAPEEVLSAAQAAFQLIQHIQPDVIVTSDDNAARYLIVPYLLDSGIPVVFAGINWTVEEICFSDAKRHRYRRNCSTWAIN